MAFLLGYPFPATAQGRFEGTVAAEWLNEGGHRKMRLTKPFTHIDAKHQPWFVPTGAVVDGASIPKAFWPMTGTPFVGAYRNASVVHDYFCDVRTRRWQDVHRMFYEAMLDAGVGPKRALLMYKAVERFGPRWKEPKISAACEALRTDGEAAGCLEGYVPPDAERRTFSRDEFVKFLGELEPLVDKIDIQMLRISSSLLGKK
jgi:hypothetical protein